MNELVDVFSKVLAVCGGISCIAAAVAVVAQIFVKIGEPNKKQDERISKLEEEIKKLKEENNQRNEQFEKMQKGNQVTQRAILALLSHGIDGNAVEGMRRAKEDLEGYLTGKY